MLSVKRRLNVSLSPDVERVLVRVAARDQMPQATKAAHLIRLALELEEDMQWNELAELRDTKKAKFVSHKKTWL